MKKRRCVKVLILLIVLCTVFTSSVSAKGEQSLNKKNNQTKKAIIKQLTYHNHKYGFTLRLPASWTRKYVVIEQKKGETSYGSVIFYQKSTYIKNTKMAMGRLFSIVLFTKDQWKKQGADITSMTENYGIVKYKNIVYYFAGPTDVQYDPNNKKEAAEYKAMEKSISGIVKSFKLLK